MTKTNFITELYKSDQSVFTIKDLSLKYPSVAYNSLKSQIHYFIKTGQLQSLRRGIYAKNHYDPLEYATKIYNPSYISFETVLQREGMNFQYDSQIYVAAGISRTITTKTGETIIYRQIPKTALADQRGLIIKPYYALASKERVFLDVLYLYREFHFDNLNINWDKVWDYLLIYQSKSLEYRAKQYYQIYTKRNDL